MATAILHLLFFASGFAGLVYQVLWLRQLGLLFGSTAYAASMTLMIFFLGLAIGSWFWGRRVESIRRPLRAYAWLEIGIPIAALAYFGLLDAYHRIYAGVFAYLHDMPSLFLPTKALLATTLLLPAAILMGGTLPVMAHYLVRRADTLAATATLLYAVNTAGAASGAAAAGFFLPHALGYRRSYLVAIAINLGVAAVAFLLDRRSPATPALPVAKAPPPAAVARAVAAPGERAGVYAVAGLSGFAALCLEVLWTKMFAQVLHNSVYSFAAVLVVFLVALGLGSAVAHLLCRRRDEPLRLLFYLLMAAGLGVAAVPFVFHAVTGGLEYVAADARWPAYVRQVFATTATVLLPPALLVGVVFPFALKAAESFGLAAGPTIGRMVAVNTFGSIAGAGLAGFVLLPWLGLWASIRTIGLAYFAAAALLLRPSQGMAWRSAPVVALFLFATVIDPARLAIVRTDAERKEVVHQVWEGAHGVVAVVRRGKSLRIKVDNYYSLGGTGAATYERTQADLPLVVHGNPRSVFFLGLGTGITAGAAVEHPVERITVAELIPEVVEASRLYFGDYTNELFDDPRVRIIVEDGRNYLRGTAETYDVIVADLFIPWQAGAASLYTIEHFTAVRDRLRDGGVFAQWLPLYQLSRDEFFVIARTMLEVFPQVTLWRGDFLPDRPIVALMGHATARPLDVAALVDGFRQRKGEPGADRRAVLATTLLFYAGNVTADADRYAGYFVNSDDWPVIEYSAPITQREVRGGAARWFVGADLTTYYAEIAAATPPAEDPFLAHLAGDEAGFVEAGSHLYASKVHQRLGNEKQAAEHVEAYQARMPASGQAGR